MKTFKVGDTVKLKSFEDMKKAYDEHEPAGVNFDHYYGTKGSSVKYFNRVLTITKDRSTKGYNPAFPLYLADERGHEIETSCAYWELEHTEKVEVKTTVKVMGIDIPITIEICDGTSEESIRELAVTKIRNYVNTRLK